MALSSPGNPRDTVSAMDWLETMGDGIESAATARGGEGGSGGEGGRGGEGGVANSGETSQHLSDYSPLLVVRGTDVLLSEGGQLSLLAGLHLDDATFEGHARCAAALRAAPPSQARAARRRPPAPQARRGS